MTSQFRKEYNTHTLGRYRHCLSQARNARIAGDNLRFWAAMRLARLMRDRYMWAQ